MSDPTQSQTNISVGLDNLERVLFSSLTTLLCCIFFCINVIMLFTLRSKLVFRETCRYILLYNLILADTLQMAVSQILYMMSVCKIMSAYPVCGLLVMFANLTNEISPLTLVLMSLERYVAVCYPLRHANIVTIRNTEVAILLIWAFCSVNILIRVLLLLEFPFKELQSLQIKKYICDTFLMFLTPVSHEYDKAYSCFLFVSAFVGVTSSYIGVILAARSASADKASARKARNTLLLHLVQLGFSLSSTVNNALILVISKTFSRRVLLLIQNVFYVLLFILPRCLSALIYGLRDQTIRPILMYNLCCRLKLSVITTKAKISP
ncbi:odorant receptor 131-2-like [Archocentrus centrarchus]|uniref:odorant receptor 131-2-like n=1 Tax=Archocentrus centrarchus TaxID=63155 RepID=UPI0011EA0FA1|nr:odorant receptor 131-2-like [Archocentrus centrarchus]